jgi:hypothetical protein
MTINALKAIIIITMVIAPSVNALEWVYSNGESCAVACFQKNNKKAFSTGKYKNGNPFYVCRTNARNEGYRPGFNLQPNWSNKCFVSLGEDGTGYPSYDCLCW